MRVMMVAPYFHPRVGGMENYVLHISKLLVQQHGADVAIVCSDWDRGGHSKELVGSLRVYRLPYLFKVSSTPVNPVWQRELTSLVLEERPDIVNGHTPVPYIADVACRVAHKRRIPFVLTYQNDLIGTNGFLRLLSKAYYRLLGIKTLELSSRIIVTSHHYALSSPYLKDFATKTVVAPVGCDTMQFDMIPQHFNSESQRVLFVGQLDKASQHKGLTYLIEAMKIVTQTIKGAELLVIGKGNYAHHYRELTRRLGMETRVRFAGFVPDEDLPGYYNGCALLALPSYNRAEGFGMVLVEAQACGKPVVGTTVGGIPAAVEDGKTGILVPPRNSQALAQAISKLLMDKELSSKLGKQAYQRVRQEFTWQRSAERHYEIYSEILS